MRKIRADLVGIVMAGGRTLAAGQPVPEDLDVHESLIEGSAPAEDDQGGSAADQGDQGTDETPAVAEDDKGDAEDDSQDEDFSDILSDDSAEPPAKAPARGGRKPAAKRG